MRKLDWRAISVGASASVAASVAFAATADQFVSLPDDPNEGPVQSLEEFGVVILAGLIGFVIGAGIAAFMSRNQPLTDGLLATAGAYAILLVPLLMMLEAHEWYDPLLLLLFPGTLVVLAGIGGALLGYALKAGRHRFTTTRSGP